MVRSRFPGKPSKLLSRKKVTSFTDSGDADGIKVAEDTYTRLAVFNSLFPETDEDSSFHGFSPPKKGPPKLRLSQGPSRMSPAVKSKTKGTRETGANLKSEKPRAAAPTSTAKASTPSDEKVTKKSENSTSACFVLPTRSAHSSRVIKPNKRFLESDPVDVVPPKKPRPSRDASTECSRVLEKASDVTVDTPTLESKSVGVLDSGVNSANDGSCQTTPKPHQTEEPSSPAKFVLRKPTLNITSQPFSTVESRFSTSGNAVFKDSNSRHATKVVCGVCGIMKSYRYIGQARKFGIHSCDYCRRFIVRMIRMEREKTLEQLCCVSGTGNCPIRQSSLAVCKSFTVEEPSINKADKEISNRCKGCWLNLCLRSFKLLEDLSNRLAGYLPRELSKSTNNGMSANWGELERICGDKVTSNKANSSESSSHKKKARNDVCAIKTKGKQKNASGPRVKHVCRSASLVLGQPVATFDGPPNKSPPSDPVHISNEIERKTLAPCSADRALVPLPSNEKPKKIEEVVIPDERMFKERCPNVPIARMLQDLGRDNCDLLDGFERYDVEKKLAKVSIDFWESYDPEEVSQTGFSLIGFNPVKFRPLCYICGSAGLEKLIHCANCCEPYHTFCVSSLRFETVKKEWWKIDWLCPKCTNCEVCSKTGSGQIGCSKCFKSYHASCLPSGRANISDCNWVCPSCLECKSCKDSSVHMLVGNIPLCKNCFKLRKKGNYCPLCQGCYDDNDYDTKMMECAECSHWIHAKCEKLTDEKYQFLSYLPATIEFVCSNCSKNRPAFWMTAVSDQLKTGCLNVIKTLSKNRTFCTVVKASPVKLPKCSCQDSRSKPIMLKNLNSHFDSSDKSGGVRSPDDSTLTSTTATDLGLLTPKLTKDDEASLETVKTGLLSLVKDNNKAVIEASKIPIYDFHEDEYDPTLTLNRTGGRLLSILDNNRGKVSELPVDKSEPAENKCNCSLLDGAAQPLSLMDIKKKSSTGDYASVFEFNKDMEKVIKDISDDKLLHFYHETLKQAFPWFDPNEQDVHDTSSHNIDSINESKTLSGRKSFESDYSLSPRKIPPPKPAFTALLDRDPKYYYIGVTSQDLRMCMLCKGTGEGDPYVQGRLLYCGQNEWVHANCALWSSEVFEEIDGSLQNVQSAISRARLIRCSGCGNKGASVGCCARSCPSAYHFACAQLADCVFLDNKEVYCKAHVHCRGNKELHKEENYPLPRPIYVELDHKKKKEILVNDVRLSVGSLIVEFFGEIISEFSDLNDYVLPNNFQCGRLFWSIKEPWKLVKYVIQAKVIFPAQDLTSEYETNYTINHGSLETPPPSPGEDKNSRYCADENEVIAVIHHLMDVVCSKEEENNFADQQTTDFLLPPEIKDALFEDLPHDLLDGISMHDIFTKMNFDEALLSEPKTEEPIMLDNNRRDDGKTSSKYSKKNVGHYYKPTVGSKRGDDRGDCNRWKRSEIIQVDGAMDFSESDHSNDSCDVQMTSNGCDSPVKCGRCRRTYRSSIGFERHLPTCSDDLSGSESESSEEDLGVAGETYYKTIETNCKVETTCIETVLKPVEHSVCNGVTNHINSYQGAFETHLTPAVETVPQETTYLSTVQTNLMDPVMDVQSSPTIILQQMPVESPATTYMQAFPQQAPQTTYAQQAPTNIQYIVNSEKSQFLTPNINGGYHIQSTNVVPNVSPTVVGTIINSNGIDQIVLNNTAPSIEMYAPQQSNVLITNTPMIVGMETVVSNTVMSSSQFISGSMPGMLASSYSATTTQVFHKPAVIDVPQSYVVVDTSPPVVNNVPCVVRNAPSVHPWNNYQTTYQESSYKMNKNVSFQTVTRQIITEQKEIDGVKLNSTQETIYIEPFSGKSDSRPLSEVRPITEIKEVPVKGNKPALPKFINGTKPAIIPPKAQPPKVNQAKLVELPNSSAIHKEKPQQAVAPVVVKQLPVVNTINPPQEKPESKKTFSPANNEPARTNKSTETPQSSNTSHKPSQPPVNTARDPPSLILKPLVQRTYSYKAGKPVNQPVPKPVLPKPPVMPEKEKPKPKPVDTPKQKPQPSTPQPPPNVPLPLVAPQFSVIEEPKMIFEIISDDGFSFSTSNLEDAWKKIYDSVQKARESKGLPPLTKNPFSSPEAMLNRLLGMGNNSVKYIMEQLPGISGCTNYKPVYHKKKPTALEQELARKTKENKSGCSRSEKFKHAHIKYDMFSWLASRHRRPPKLLFSDNDGLSINRRATSMNLPMAMRFRHLKETSKMSVGVFRSDIHGRGLFCLRDIDSGEMVIEYAGEVIRSALTDKRERYYTARGIGCYMFRIDDKFVVDATMKGNAARFINHSCEPNCYSKVVDILGKKHILIFALRKILQGEELTYDYKFPLEEEKISCHCLSRRCRKYLN